MKFDFLWFDRSTAYTLENEQGDIFFLRQSFRNRLISILIT